MHEMTREDWKEAMEAWRRIEDTVSELDDVVRGDTGRNIRGLVRDMEVVNAFILKWEKREYAFRAVILLLGSNIVLTAVAIIAQFLMQ